MTDKQTRKKIKLLTVENIEEVLAVVIDDLYLEMKPGFVDYKAKTHQLGHFKENVKLMFHKRIREYLAGV